MRLGQFARKYDLRVQDIVSYLGNESDKSIHSNTKLDKQEELDILDFFGISVEETTEESDENQIESSTNEIISGEENQEAEENTVERTISPLEDIASVEGEISIHQNLDEKESWDESVNKNIPKKIIHAEDEIIQTDRLLEILESEDIPADLDKIKLIKAAKRELSGLKVLGKVELPEPKKKIDPMQEEKKSSRVKQRAQLSEEEKEKRRLKAKRKKEAFEARQEKRKKEQEAKQIKELKAQHYKQKIRKTEVSQKPIEKPLSPSTQPSSKKEQVAKPKTLIGKWWRWMNT